MRVQDIDQLRHQSRKLIRELGLLELNRFGDQHPPQYWHAMIEIAKAPGITISELSRLLVVSLSTTSRLVKSLINNQVVRFEPGEDKREQYLFITDDGKNQLTKVDEYSIKKIRGAFNFLSTEQQHNILQSITWYAEALEQHRQFREQVNIKTLPSSKIIRQQVVTLLETIQKDEFKIPITKDVNAGILKAENEYYYNKSLNFWYAVDDNGIVIGCIGLRKINDRIGEIKKCFVVPQYRGAGLAQKLLFTLLRAAQKHKFTELYLGSAGVLKGSHKFYQKCGFVPIKKSDLPAEYDLCVHDKKFFHGNISELQDQIAMLID